MMTRFSLFQTNTFGMVLIAVMCYITFEGTTFQLFLFYKRNVLGTLYQNLIVWKKRKVIIDTKVSTVTVTYLIISEFGAGKLGT